MSSLDRFARDKLAGLDHGGLKRGLTETGRGPAAAASRGGTDLISFCCNDYLGLSQHPLVKQAAAAALEEFGMGAGASRLVTGNHPLYARLEAALASFRGAEAALVFGSGYLANLGTIPALMGAGDLIIGDELIHASLHAGARASRAGTVLFRHNDPDGCRRLLAERRSGYERCLILTEGVFSMDGDRAPLAELAALATEHDCWLLVDDAHGFGVLGDGRGAVAEAGCSDAVSLQIGTLSKAVGAYGGFLAASRPVVELMISRARSLVYATALPPPVVAASLAALQLMAVDATLCAAPLENARQFTTALGLPEAASPIVPLIVGAPDDAMAASAALERDGFLVTAIRPPTVPEGTARLRFTFSAAHRGEDVAALAASVRRIGLAA